MMGVVGKHRGDELGDRSFRQLTVSDGELKQAETAQRHMILLGHIDRRHTLAYRQYLQEQQCLLRVGKESLLFHNLLAFGHLCPGDCVEDLADIEQDAARN
jgi:hypothetical protein